MNSNHTGSATSPRVSASRRFSPEIGIEMILNHALSTMTGVRRDYLLQIHTVQRV